eukprot:gnl/Carplike_NY0171/2064_a2779_667.p1 GENE.gnl/Carplike_NY0171/2064_a2779_667~~gnl/Carplike_NY0171/2064_a2779_667.p1  ORF type:complete len:349 (-),score=78.11 gnl/Carplike_NY0171/2064_a2779_667:36-968(-)
MSEGKFGKYFRGFKNLHSLIAQNCHLSSLDGLEKCTALSTLMLQHNELISVSSVTSTLPHLRRVCLQHNFIPSFPILSASKDSLTQLRLRDNSILNIDDSARELASFPRLRHLDISHNPISNQKALLSWLSSLRSVEHISLAGIPALNDEEDEEEKEEVAKEEEGSSKVDYKRYPSYCSLVLKTMPWLKSIDSVSVHKLKDIDLDGRKEERIAKQKAKEEKNKKTKEERVAYKQKIQGRIHLRKVEQRRKKNHREKQERIAQLKIEKGFFRRPPEKMMKDKEDVVRRMTTKRGRQKLAKKTEKEREKKPK